jgi:hypothetical protein
MSGCKRVMDVWTGEHTVTGFLKAMLRIAMRCEDSDRVTTVLEANGCVDHEALCSTDTEIGVEEDDILRLFGLLGPHRDMYYLWRLSLIYVGTGCSAAL